jgi:putative SOS response-associated peptidase YedK
MPKIQPINARAETLGTSGMFREAFKRRRCLIPADGFYEWKKSPDKKTKQPYFIHFKDDRPFAFGGLWERWKSDESAEPLDTCTIITTTPNKLVAEIHDRMPVIVDEHDYSRWLDPKNSGDSVHDLLGPCVCDDMEKYTVSPVVNKPTVDGPELIKPNG